MTLLEISLSKMTSMVYHFIVNRINKWTTDRVVGQREREKQLPPSMGNKDKGAQNSITDDGGGDYDYDRYGST